jgi:hypothetical protein
MAPTVGIKRSPAATQTVTAPPPSPPDARFAVREAVKSTLADPAPGARLDAPAPAPALEGFLCLEEIEGRRWKYVVDAASGNSSRRKGRRGGSAVPLGASVRAVPLQSPLPPAEVSRSRTYNSEILPVVVVPGGGCVFVALGFEFDLGELVGGFWES